MHTIVTFFAAMSVIVISACHPARIFAPEVPDPDPVQPATVDDQAVCAHLAILGCRDAWPNGGACIGLMSQARTDRIAIPSGCLSAARGIADVRACGGPDTLTFRCGGSW